MKRYVVVLGEGEFEIEFSARTSLVALLCAHGIADGFGFINARLDDEQNEVAAI